MHQSTENYILYKRNDAKTKKRLHEIRREGRKSFLNKFDVHNMNKNWAILKQYKKACNPIYRDNNSTSLEWLKEFLCLWTPDSVNEEEDVFKDSINIQTFTLKELKGVIEKLPDTSPGMDGISYKMIKYFPDNVLEILLNFYNKFLLFNLIPAEWKNYDIIPILKPGKSNLKAESYRPIGKSSCLAKVFEHLLKIRLEMFTKKSIPYYSMGFRKGYSTCDCLNTFVSDIYKNLCNKYHTLALFLDISRAYDSVNLKLLWRKMFKLKIPAIFIQFLNSYYTERCYYTTYKGVREGPRTTSTGLPQGAVLSPILFLIYTTDLQQHIDTDIGILQYADDFLIYVKDKNITILTKKMNDLIKKISFWLKENSFVASEEKS